MSQTPPRLLDSEPSPAQKTVYLEIPLGNWPPVTGVFFPAGYDYNLASLNVLIYLHGDRFEGSACEGAKDIKAYWSGKLFPLRQLTNDSKSEKAILVAPTLGPRPGAGGLTPAEKWGVLVDKIDWYLDQVACGIAAYGPQARPVDPSGAGGATPVPDARIKKIVLAAHSGGGAPMLALANQLTSGNSFDASALKQCWGFDSLYQGPEPWLKLARRTNVWVNMCAGSSTKESCAELERLAKTEPRTTQVTVLPSFYDVPLGDWAPRREAKPTKPVLRKTPTGLVYGHCDVPRNWWGMCMRQSFPP
ncbi:hypothetical protein OJF2_77150 [Aquisphaera giovannonii]|uniref:Alpha/beta hydrolase family protein n=1 Tax=Aquisphaera giovannonii TaxID=406548 RepID=A0A5B9WF56_9BACT|nr:hypothetical protein [Aquisphaera giovannonii]QEH39103.1 hypothetical protein OJF2_77150 [Aquisphaera giovannonii]